MDWIDNRTGLMWTRNGNLAGSGTWFAALDYVAAMNRGKGFCGHNDWRLPSRNELRSLVNRSQVSTAHWLNTQGFSNVQVYYYWSSTTNGVGSGEAWIVSSPKASLGLCLFTEATRLCKKLDEALRDARENLSQFELRDQRELRQMETL